MANAILGVPIDNGILTASEDSAATAQNLLSKYAGDTWTSAGGAAPYIVYDMLELKDILSVAVLYSNAAAATTIRVRTATSEANLTAAPASDSTAVNFHHDTTFAEHPRTHHLVFPSVNVRWVRLDFAHTGVLRIGRLVVSEKVQSSVNIQQNFVLDISEEVRTAKTESSEFSGSGLVTRSFTLNFRVKTADKRLLQSVLNERGFSGEVLLIMNPDDPTGFMDEVLYGRIASASIPHIVGVTGGDIFEIPLTVTEFEKP